MDEVYVGSDMQEDGTYGSLELMPVGDLNKEQVMLCHAEEAIDSPQS